MSYRKGYNYDNVNEFCEKYNCILLTTREEIDLKPVKFDITSTCGHNSSVVFNKLLNNKIGIYCDKCFKNINMFKCFGCSCMFKPPNTTAFLYCSVTCAGSSRKHTEEQKQKFRNTFHKKMGYYDENGDLLNDDDIKKEKLKKDALYRRKIGIKERKIYTYEMIKSEYEKEGCELLTTEEEFDKDNSHKIFKIKGKCGCIIEFSSFKSFLHKKCNVNCKKCTNNNTSVNSKNTSKINGIPKTMIIEKNGIDLIQEKCKNNFVIMKTRECCEADILVKPINEEKNIWLPIQLKVTSKKLNGFDTSVYQFMIGKQYNDMLLLLVCIEDAKFWLFESNDKNINSLQRITITDTKSKYDKANVNDLNEIFNYWYDKNLYNVTFGIGNTPQSEKALLEYKYVMLREENIKFLNFVHNTMDGLVYDFKIDNLKIQEKVCTPSINTHYISLKKCGGWKRDETKKIQITIPYFEGDNDFYWFNIQDDNTFYVVPEIELINRGFISTKNSEGKKSMGTGSNEHWLCNYKFHYVTINEEENKEKLLAIIYT